MCLRAKVCSELGDDPANWPKHAPLLPPTWFDNEVTKLTEAVRAAAAGDLEKASAKLAQVRSDDLRKWVADHGEQAGYQRAKHFGRKLKNTDKELVDRSRQATALQEKFVYERDRYRCRYCSSRVIPGIVLKLFSQVMGDDFGITGTRQQHHGAAVALRACADHVVPHARGGQTNAENLVTACWPCNFAKAGYAIEEIGIEDPRLRPPKTSDDWDGLMSLVPELQ
ncbi:MAG TPA: HNH endonuclease [Pyrinomonadaceae bacterium]|jgi:5-methylcytosine-specific restriction endonuclease McrA